MNARWPAASVRIAMPFLVAAVLAITLPIRSLGAQVCVGGTTTSPGWLAVSAGRASGNASVVGADFAWQFSHRLSLVGNGRVTEYPAVDPRRDHVALGIAYTFAEWEHVGICVTPGYQIERIGDLHVARIPVGVSIGWTALSRDGVRRLGVRVEPFFVYSRESIAMFSQTSRFVSGRAGVVGAYHRWLLGLEYEDAFDHDARWNTRIRFGYALK
jgi:hypothetical protein